VRIGLTVPRAILYDRLAGRVARMVELGWVEEVASLLQRGVGQDLPAFQAIGYRQIARHVRGEWSLAAAIEDTVRATRRFAKRQLTWFRKEPDVTWFDATEVEGDLSPVLAHLQANGLGRFDG
jgi:tRNA dimethylallyltransferase